MFGNALDAMISQAGQGATRDPVRILSNAPQPGTSLGGGETPGGSFFSAASPITAGASSRGSSPFGALTPDFSRLTPDQLKKIQDTLSGIIYSVPLGGYITQDEANNPNSAFVKGYYGRQMTGGDPSANRQAQSIYSMIGDLPTRPIGTRALNALPGYNPSSGPSYNTQLRAAGQGAYGGPWQFPGWG